MSKTMEKIRFFKRWWDNPATRNPTIASTEHITEVVFEPFIDQLTNEKWVYVEVIDWCEDYAPYRNKDGEWDKKETWTKEIVKRIHLTPEEANKEWLKCKKTKYVTQKTPKELFVRI